MRLRSGKQATYPDSPDSSASQNLEARLHPPLPSPVEVVPETQEMELLQPPSSVQAPPLPSPIPTFKDKLLGATSGSAPETEESFCLRAEDVRLGMNGNIPTIDFADHILDSLNRRMGFSVIIKLLGRNIGYRPLRTRLQHLWSPSESFQLIDLDDNCFLVKFRNEFDYHHALMNGPWVIFGHCLSVQPWSPSFNPQHHSISRIVTWVRLPKLPIRYYQHEVLTSIGNVLGEVIKVDYNTASGDRGRFARLAVILDLSKPLTSKLQINGEIIYIEYEGLPSICFACGCYGHSRDACPVNQAAPNQGSLLAPACVTQPRDMREIQNLGSGCCHNVSGVPLTSMPELKPHKKICLVGLASQS